MADTSLIPHIPNAIVEENILPRLPWHTRPLLIALNGAWNNELDAIGVKGQDGLNPTGQRIAEVTRLKQPIKCRLAVDYCYQDPIGKVQVKIFDGQWRNVPHIPKKWEKCPNAGFDRGKILGVVDGTLYFVGWNGRSMIALNVGSGLWQWKFVCTSHESMSCICTSGRTAGGLFAFNNRRIRGSAYFNITEITGAGEVREVVNREDARFTHRANCCSSQPFFVHVGYGLYFFGLQHYTTGIWFYDLNQRSFTVGRKAYSIDTWFDQNGFRHRSRRSPLTVYVETTVLLLVDCDGHLEILRYSSSTATWIIVGWMRCPGIGSKHWSWCVEYDDDGEKQLWIYLLDGTFKLQKRRVAQKMEMGGNNWRGKVWNDSELPLGIVECKVDCEEQFEAPGDINEAGEDVTLCVRKCHGFHRSDSPNFADIPRDSEPKFRAFGLE